MQSVCGSLSVYACSAASVHRQCKDSLYIYLALLLMYCITPPGISSDALPDWAAWLQRVKTELDEILCWCKEDTWQRLSRNPTHISEAVCPLSLGWNCTVTWGSGFEGDPKCTPITYPPPLTGCVCSFYNNLSNSIKPCDPFAKLRAWSVYGHFPWKKQRKWRNLLRLSVFWPRLSHSQEVS